MSGIALCAYCGGEVDADEAYKFDRDTPYCSEGCFEAQQEASESGQ